VSPFFTVISAGLKAKFFMITVFPEGIVVGVPPWFPDCVHPAKNKDKVKDAAINNTSAALLFSILFF
jgi:hypothetical protein